MVEQWALDSESLGFLNHQLPLLVGAPHFTSSPKRNKSHFEVENYYCTLEVLCAKL